MFTSDGVRDAGGNRRRTVAAREQEQAELLQKVQDLLIAAGYFRARLNIDPFDKILGGMCWCITGSNVDVDIEFEDDLTMGQKIKLSEKITVALKEMECPTQIAAYQIQGLDYGKTYPVMQWLIKKLMESRDTRAALNRKQGLLNYNRFFKRSEQEHAEDPGE